MQRDGCRCRPSKIVLVSPFPPAPLLKRAFVRRRQWAIMAIIKNYHCSERIVRLRFWQNIDLAANAKESLWSMKFSVCAEREMRSINLRPKGILQIHNSEFLLLKSASQEALFSVCRGKRMPFRVRAEPQAKKPRTHTAYRGSRLRESGKKVRKEGGKTKFRCVDTRLTERFTSAISRLFFFCKISCTVAIFKMNCACFLTRRL